MPSLTEKPWFIAICIPIAILGIGGGMCYFLLHLLTSSHESGHHDTSSHESGHHDTSSHKSGHHDWSYGEGSEGPDHWGGITPGAIASKGIRQSPIDINSSTAVVSSQLGKGPSGKTTLGPIEFNYSGTKFYVMNNGHTIQVDCESTVGNTITIDGQKYELLQFHFHARSEHKINGKDYPMELHLVHRLSESSKDKAKLNPVQYAVVGVMITEGEKPNKIIEQLWPKNLKMPKPDDDPYIVQIGEFTEDDFLPQKGARSYFRYHGSLTTPPCTENVLWTVMEKPISFSKEQIKDFTEASGEGGAKYEKSRRPIQGAFHRLIMSYSDVSDSSSATTTPSTSPITSASSFVVPVQPSGIQ